MASASLGREGAGSSRTANGFKGPSSSVDWLGTEMLAMNLRDKVDHDDDRVDFWIFLLTQESIHYAWLLMNLGITPSDISCTNKQFAIWQLVI